MAFFKRQRADTDIPELQEYYAAKRANNSASAWALALLSLIVTVAVIMGAFFGGRWAWRKLKGNDNAKQVATIVEQKADQADGVVSSEGGVSTTDEEQAAKKAAAVAEAAKKAAEAEAARVASEAEAAKKKADAEAVAKAAASSAQAVTGQSNVPTEGKIPNSGPGDVVAIFIGATTAGYLISRKKLLQSN